MATKTVKKLTTAEYLTRFERGATDLNDALGSGGGNYTETIKELERYRQDLEDALKKVPSDLTDEQKKLYVLQKKRFEDLKKGFDILRAKPALNKPSTAAAEEKSATAAAKKKTAAAAAKPEPDPRAALALAREQAKKRYDETLQIQKALKAKGEPETDEQFTKRIKAKNDFESADKALNAFDDKKVSGENPAIKKKEDEIKKTENEIKILKGNGVDKEKIKKKEDKLETLKEELDKLKNAAAHGKKEAAKRDTKTAVISDLEKLRDITASKGEKRDINTLIAEIENDDPGKLAFAIKKLGKEKTRVSDLKEKIRELEEIQENINEYKLTDKQKKSAEKKIKSAILKLRQEIIHKTSSKDEKSWAYKDAENLRTDLRDRKRDNAGGHIWDSWLRPTQADDPNSPLHGTFNSAGAWLSGMFGSGWDLGKDFFKSAANPNDGKMDTWGQPLLQYGGALLGTWMLGGFLIDSWTSKIPIIGGIIGAVLKVGMFLVAAKMIGKTMEPRNGVAQTGSRTGTLAPGQKKLHIPNGANNNAIGRNPRNSVKFTNTGNVRHLASLPQNFDRQDHYASLPRVDGQGAADVVNVLQKTVSFKRKIDYGHASQSARASKINHVPRNYIIAAPYVRQPGGGNHMPWKDPDFVHLTHEKGIGMESGIHNDLSTQTRYVRYGGQGGGYQPVAYMHDTGMENAHEAPENTHV